MGLVLLASLACHAALGLLALASIRQVFPDAAPPMVDVVFEVMPAPPEPAVAERAPSPAPAEDLAPPTPEPAVPPPAEPAPLPMPLPPVQALPDLPATVPPPAAPVAPHPAPTRPAPPPATRPPPRPQVSARLPRAPPPETELAAPRAGSPPAPPPPATSTSATSTPATAAPAAPAPAVINAAWRGAVAAWVQARRRYPDEARRRNIEGDVILRLTVSHDGQALDAKISRPSGSDLLDQAATSLVREGRMPPFPPDMTQPQVTISIAIRYRLED